MTRALALPEKLSPNALLEVLNLLTTREELEETLRALAERGGGDPESVKERQTDTKA